MRGLGAGSATSAINYISDFIGQKPERNEVNTGLKSGIARGALLAYGLSRDPRRGCGSDSPFVPNLGYSSAKGYQYNVLQKESFQTQQKKFSLWDFIIETVIGGLTGGFSSAAFYGVGKGIEKLREGFRTGKGGTDAIDDVLENARKSLYDEFGNYTGGRSREELDALADDPAHAGSNRPIDIQKGIHEREVGLGLEESGKVDGPIIRDPSGKAEFIDANGQAWDVKSFNSNYKPKQGGYTLQKSMDEIYDSLSKNEYVMLDTTNLSDAHKAELLQEIADKGLVGKVIVWP